MIMLRFLTSAAVLLCLTTAASAQRYLSYDEGWRQAHAQRKNLTVARQVPDSQLPQLAQDAVRKGYVFAVTGANDTRLRPGVTDVIFTQTPEGVRVGAVSQRCFYQGLPAPAPVPADPLVLAALRELLIGQAQTLSLLQGRDSRVILLPIVLRQHLEIMPPLEMPLSVPPVPPPPIPMPLPQPPPQRPWAGEYPSPYPYCPCPQPMPGQRPMMPRAGPQPVGVEDPGPAAPYPQNYSIIRTLHPPRTP